MLPKEGEKAKAEHTLALARALLSAASFFSSSRTAGALEKHITCCVRT